MSVNELEPEAPLDGVHVVARTQGTIRDMKWLRIIKSSDLLAKNGDPGGGTVTLTGNFAGLSLELRAVFPNNRPAMLQNRNNQDDVSLGSGEAAWSELRRRLAEVNALCELAYSSLTQIDLAYAAAFGERVAFKLDTVTGHDSAKREAEHAAFMAALKAKREDHAQATSGAAVADTERGYAAAIRDQYDGLVTPVHRRRFLEGRGDG